jgi:hypothetical protein
MEDRKASLVAVGVSSIAIGGFWMARPNAEHAGLRVLEQRNLPFNGIGLDRDAAVLFRIAIPASFRDREKAIQFRIVDRQKHVFPVLPMTDPGFPDSLKLQRGYAYRADRPHLVAVCDSELLGSVPVGDLPDPEAELLDPKPNLSLSLVKRDGWIDVIPRGRIPRDERWRVEALRTPYGRVADVWTMLPNRGFRSINPGLTIPFANEVQAVEIEVTRFRFEQYECTVDIPNLRLQQREGGVIISVDKGQERSVRLGSFVASVDVPKQETGPLPGRKSLPPTVGRAMINIEFSEGVSSPFGERRDPPKMTRTGVEIVSPLPSALGLSELRLGPTFLQSDLKPGTPIKTGPFTARLRLTAWKPKAVGSFTAVVPVEIDPDAPKGPSFFFAR